MIKTLKPLLLSHNFNKKEINAMIDRTAHTHDLTREEYLYLFDKCIKLDTDLMQDKNNIIYILANINSKIFRLIPLEINTYTDIMKRATIN